MLSTRPFLHFTDSPHLPTLDHSDHRAISGVHHSTTTKVQARMVARSIQHHQQFGLLIDTQGAIARVPAGVA